MASGQKNFHKSFACVSPVFVSLALALLGGQVALAAPHRSETANSNADIPKNTKRSTASAPFTRAEEQRAALNNKPTEKRVPAE